MTKYLHISAALILSVFLFAGCPKKPPNPTPEDTILGPGEERVDYVITTDAYGGEDLLVRRPNEELGRGYQDSLGRERKRLRLLSISNRRLIAFVNKEEEIVYLDFLSL